MRRRFSDNRIILIKKIAFIGGRNIHTLGGIENYMLNLATALTARGYSVVVYCESERFAREDFGGVKVIHWKRLHCNYLDKPVLGLLSTLHALLWERHVDLFHYNAWPPSLWSWLPMLCRRKTLMQGHGLEWQRTKYSVIQQKLMRLMECITAYTNRNLVMVSQDQTDFFMRKYGRRCTTITPAISLPDPVPADVAAAYLAKLGLRPEGYFLYMGRLVKDKNPDVLIRAFLRFKQDKVKLVVAGDNTADPGYVGYLKSLAGQASSVVFPGAVYGDEKFALLQNALAFCIPSALEGLPISLLEAMSWRRFCIASDIPGCREALGDGGCFVPEAELEDGLCREMARLIAAPSSIAAAGEKNFNRSAAWFTWDRIAGQYIDYISSL